MRFGPGSSNSSAAPGDDAATQQISRGPTRQRVTPRLPGSLDPAGRTADGTEVMSLDELMDLAAETSTVPPPPPPAAPPVNRPASPPRPSPAATRPAPPVTPKPAPARAPARAPERTGPDLRERMLADARRAYAAGLDQSREWLRKGDNGLIAATVALALLLLLVVAAL